MRLPNDNLIPKFDGDGLLINPGQFTKFDETLLKKYGGYSTKDFDKCTKEQQKDAYLKAMKACGANDSLARSDAMKKLEPVLGKISNAVGIDEEKLAKILYEVFSSFSGGKVEDLINLFEAKLAEITSAVKDEGNPNETKLNELLGKFTGYSEVTNEDYDALLELLNALGIKYDTEETKENGQTKTTIKFNYGDKEYSFYKVVSSGVNTDGDKVADTGTVIGDTPALGSVKDNGADDEVEGANKSEGVGGDYDELGLDAWLFGRKEVNDTDLYALGKIYGVDYSIQMRGLDNDDNPTILIKINDVEYSFIDATKDHLKTRKEQVDEWLNSHPDDSEIGDDDIKEFANIGVEYEIVERYLEKGVPKIKIKIDDKEHVFVDTTKLAKKKEDIINEWLGKHKAGSNLDDTALNELVNFGGTYVRFLDKKNGSEDIPMIKVTIDGKDYIFVDKTTDAEKPRTNEQKLQDILKVFASGNMTYAEFDAALKELGIDTSKDAVLDHGVQDENDYVVVDITYNGKKYHVECIYKAAKDGKDDISVLTFDKSVIDAVRQQGIDISKYFEVVAYTGDDKNKGALVYALKSGIVLEGITADSSAQDIITVINGGKVGDINNPDPVESTYSDELTKILDTFAKGDMTYAELDAALKKLGIDTSKDAVLDHGVQDENDYLVIDITYNGKNYHVECIYNAAKDGKDDIRQNIISADEYNKIIKEYPGLKDFFKVAVSVNGTALSYIKLDSVNGKTFDEAKAELEQKEADYQGFVNDSGAGATVNSSDKVENADGIDFRTKLGKILEGINKKLEEEHGEKFTSIKGVCIDELVNKYKSNYANLTVGEIVDEYLRLVYDKLNAPQEKVDISDEEKAFINEILEESEWEVKSLYTTDKEFDDIGDMSDEMEKAIDAMKNALKAKFLAILGDGHEDEFNKLFDQNKELTVKEYAGSQTAVPCKTVIDFFLKKMYAEVKDKMLVNKQEIKDFREAVKAENGNWSEDICEANKVSIKDKEFDISINSVFDSNGNVVDGTTAKAVYDALLAKLKDIANGALTDDQLAKLLKYAWAEVAKGDWTDKTSVKANKFITAIQGKIYEILGNETQLAAAIKSEIKGTATGNVDGGQGDDAPETETKTVLKGTISSIIKTIAGDDKTIDLTSKDKYSSVVASDSTSSVGGGSGSGKSPLETRFDEIFNSLESYIKDIYEAVKNQSDFDTWKEQLISNCKAGLNGELTTEQIVDLIANEAQKMLGSNSIEIDYDGASAETITVTKGGQQNPAVKNEADPNGVYGKTEYNESDLSGISANDIGTYFYKEGDKYKMKLTALHELFPGKTDADLANITIEELKAALTSKNLKLSKISGYENNAPVSNNYPGGSSTEKTRKAGNEAFKGKINQIKAELKGYIKSIVGFELTDEEYDKLIDKILNDSKSGVYSKISCTANNYTFNVKEAVDAFIDDIKAFCNKRENNPSLRTFTEAEIKLAHLEGCLSSETSYFIESGGLYKLNIALLNDKDNSPVKEFLAAGGRVTDLESLRRALVFSHKIEGTPEKVKISSFEQNTTTGKRTIEAYLNDKSTKFDFNFKFNSDGTITFSGTDKISGTDIKVSAYNDQAFSDLRDALAKTYKDDLEFIFAGSDYSTISDNIFYIAFNNIVSNGGMQKDEPLSNVMSSIIDEYDRLIKLAAQDVSGERTEFIKNYNKTGSNGGTLLRDASVNNNNKDFSVGGTVIYKGNSTKGGDDWVDFDNDKAVDTNPDKQVDIGNHKFTNGGVTVYQVKCTNKDDAGPLNKAILELLAKYLDRVDVTGLTAEEAEAKKRDVVKLFNESIKKAVEDLDAVKANKDNLKTKNIYYKDNCYKNENLVSVQSILYQIMYIMDSKIVNSLFP